MPFFSRQQQKPNNSKQMTDRMLQVISKYYSKYQTSIKANNIISSMSMVIIPFMQNVLRKYDEYTFHKVMSSSYVDETGKLCFGFDFVGDWRKNHTFIFNMLLPIARSQRKNLDFNVDIATQMIIDIMTSAWNWKLSNIERQALRHNIYRIKRLLY